MQHPGSHAERARQIGFLLVPGFSQLALSAAVEPLRMANHLAGRTLFDWVLLSHAGESVRASNGLMTAAAYGMEDSPSLDWLLVCSASPPSNPVDPLIRAWLHGLNHAGTGLGAMGTGPLILARAGLLGGHRWAMDLEATSTPAPSDAEQAGLTPALFIIDGSRATCAGGIAPLDMMLTLIGREHGTELSERIAEEYLHPRIRETVDRPPRDLRRRLAGAPQHLREAVTLMEANLHEPLSLDELAGYTGQSRRQLERLFRRHLECVPTRYYMNLRLARARQLLLYTALSVGEVARACGFISPPHFTKCYHEYHGCSPSEARRRTVSCTAIGPATNDADHAARGARREAG